MFTANPEDYTNRGSIVTPLKDRIDSQIITHYPKSIEIGKKITLQEARIKKEQVELVQTNQIVSDLIEQVAMEARESEFVDAKSGVSARLTISAYESMMSAAERRALVNGEKQTFIRVSDFLAAVPAITGKVELVYEGEQEGPGIVAQKLMGKAIRSQFILYFPEPDKQKKLKEKNAYKAVTSWFGEGHTADVLNDMPAADYSKALNAVPGLRDLIEKYHAAKDEQTKLFLMEFCLHGLAEHSLISRNKLVSGTQFKDLLSSMFTMPSFNEDDEDDLDEDDNR